MIKNGLVLAAGLSSRMGEFKPLMRLNNKTLIETSIDSLFCAGVSTVVAVLGYRAKDIEAVLKRRYNKGQLLIVYNDDYATTDMFHSIKTGIVHIGDCDAFYLLPGDMPAISPNTFLAVSAAMEATRAKITFPTVEGYKKHPPLISISYIPEILSFNEGGGLRRFWQTCEPDIATVAVDDIGCSMDADTIQDYICCVNYMKQSKEYLIQIDRSRRLVIQ